MPIERPQRTGLTDKLTVYGAAIKETVEKDPGNLYAIQELAELCKGDKKTRPHSHLVALAAGILWLSDEVTIDYRAGKLLVGAKV